MKKPFVISISGISGSGKTTIFNVMKERLTNTEVVFFDDIPGDLLGRDYCEWSDSGADYNEWDLSQLTEKIKSLLHKSLDYIILDYPFGKAHREIGAYVDWSVWLDIPMDISLARRILCDFTRRSEKRRPLKGNTAEEVSSYLDFYLARHRGTYLRHIETIKPFVDIIFDGAKSTEEVADEIINALSVRKHYDALIDENNDPVHDPEPLRTYMDKWDGKAFVDAMQLTPDKSVLEIGVGTGRLAMRVCEKCKSLIGIDISPKTVERAKENLRAFPNIRLICGEFITHEFTESFDVIYSSLTFLHVKDKKSAIQKIANILTCGGRFILSINKEQQTLLDFGNRQIEVYPDMPPKIVLLLTGAGLKIEKQFETEFAVIFTTLKE